MSKSVKYSIPFILLTGIIAFISIFSFNIRETQKYDSLRINAAGQLRMLWQQIIKEFLLHEKGIVNINQIEQTVAIFNTNLINIVNGGEIILIHDTSNPYKIQSLRNEHIEQIHSVLNQEWILIRKTIMDNINNDKSLSTEMLTIRFQEFLKGIDELVFEIQSISEEREKQLYLLLLLMIIFMVCGLLIIAVRSILKLSKAKRYITQLENILPICSKCKKIRFKDEKNKKAERWMPIENYLYDNKNIVFSHSLCPECFAILYPELDDTEMDTK